jgi:hypothetical protein
MRIRRGYPQVVTFSIVYGLKWLAVDYGLNY